MKNKDFQSYYDDYEWLNELSDKGKEEAIYQIKKFDKLGVAVPDMLIYNKYN